MKSNEIKTKAIVLDKIKYSDSGFVVKFYTLDYGLKSFIVKGLNSKKSILNKSLFFPLRLVEITASSRKSNLPYIKDISILENQENTYLDVRKSNLCFFLSELISKCVREEEKNDLLFSFFLKKIQNLNNIDNLDFFSLVFVLEFTEKLGFYPFFEKEKLFFDYKEGFFSNLESKTCIKDSEKGIFVSLLKGDFDKLNKKNRVFLLDFMMKYYSFHLENFKKPKSLSVIIDVFS